MTSVVKMGLSLTLNFCKPFNFQLLYDSRNSLYQGGFWKFPGGTQKPPEMFEGVAQTIKQSGKAGISMFYFLEQCI